MPDESLLDEIEGNLSRVRPDNFGVTVFEYMRRAGMGWEGAKATLDSLVTSGVLRCEPMRIPKSGKVCDVYSRAGGS